MVTVNQVGTNAQHYYSDHSNFHGQYSSGRTTNWDMEEQLLDLTTDRGMCSWTKGVIRFRERLLIYKLKHQFLAIDSFKVNVSDTPIYQSNYITDRQQLIIHNNKAKLINHE